MSKASYSLQLEEYLKNFIVSTPSDKLMNNLRELKSDIYKKKTFYASFKQIQHNSALKSHSIEENFIKAMESMYNQIHESIEDFIKIIKMEEKEKNESPTSIITTATTSSTSSSAASEFLEAAHNFLWAESVEVLHDDNTNNKEEKQKELEEKLKQQKKQQDEDEEKKYQELKLKLDALFQTIELEINCNSLAIYTHASHETRILMDNTSD